MINTIKCGTIPQSQNPQITEYCKLKYAGKLSVKMTRNPNLQLIQYKILHRVHQMGQRMFTLGFVLSNSCSHCQGNIPDNYIHLFRGFGAIPASPPVFLLGNLDDFTRSHFEAREMGKRGLRYPRLHKNMD